MPHVLFFHALSPLHAGTGQALDVIDLPVARYKATGMPYLPGSSIKGVVRDACIPNPEELTPLQEAAFGTPNLAGAMAFGDARLFLLPVRSLKGVFAWATSPLLLRLARNDWSAVPAEPGPQGNAQIKIAQTSLLAHGSKVFLEELDLTATRQDNWALATWLAPLLFGDAVDQEDFRNHLAVVNDETMAFLWETATQVDARNSIGDRGVAADQALWYEESLPVETVLLGLVSTVSRSGFTEQQLTAPFLVNRADLQFGGKSSIGRGRMRVTVQETP